MRIAKQKAIEHFIIACTKLDCCELFIIGSKQKLQNIVGKSILYQKNGKWFYNFKKIQLLSAKKLYQLSDDIDFVIKYKFNERRNLYKGFGEQLLKELKELNSSNINNTKNMNIIVRKFDYSKSTEDIFYKVIYPLYAKEFLFGRSYELFAELVQENFILNPTQWEYILEHWEQKENILTEEIK